MSLPTLIDIAQSTGSDGIAGLIEEVVKFVPEINAGAARTIKGIQFKTTVRTALPQTGFRAANQGGQAGKSVFEQRLYDCYITDTPWLADKAVADAHEDGSAAYIAAEAKAIMLSQMIMLGKQFYYGLDPANTGLCDALGFPGLNIQYDAANMTIDAGGSTPNGATSVYFITWGDDGCQWLYGNGTNPLQLTDVKQIVLPDPNNANALITYYHQQLLAWVGMKLGSKKRVVRIKNITQQAGHTLTDALLTKAYALFPVGYTPDVCLMSRQSQSQLVQSRQAVNPTAFVGDVPTVITDFNGVPIMRTDSIQNTEAIV
jgi:hypothetical protein